MSWLDKYFRGGYATLQGGGIALPAQLVLNVIGATLVDNPTLGRTDMTIGATLAATGIQVLAAQEYDSNVDAKGTEKNVLPKSIQTPDATVATLDSWTIPNGGFAVSAIVYALKTDYTQGGAWSVYAAFRNNAGTVAQLGTTSVQVIGTLDDASWGGPTIDNSTTTARVRVTGKAATTIRWTCITTRLEVIP